MHLSAILVTGTRSSSTTLSGDISQENVRTRGEAEPMPLACVDVLGQSILERMVAQLRRTVQNIFIVAAPGCGFVSKVRGAKVTVVDSLPARWTAAKQILAKQAQRGIERVLVAELGAYVEFDLEDVLRFHEAQKQPVTPFHDSEGELRYSVVEKTCVKAGTQCILPFRNREMGNGPEPYMVRGYVNRLRDAHDFRKLVVDAFLQRCCLSPQGREIKPGVWVDENARVHPSARIVAPAYLGSHTAVHPAALITRFSNVERRCEIGEGSVVAHASILPQTIIGRGLDVSAALVNGNEWFDLRRNIAMQIPDPNLISSTAVGQPAPPTPIGQQDPTGDDLQELEQPGLELGYPGFLSRAAGRVVEVFKDEV